jgi:Flp pilus assembly protein TadB
MSAWLAVVLAAVAAGLALGPSASALRLRQLSLRTAREQSCAWARASETRRPILASTQARAGSAVMAGVVTWSFVSGFPGLVVGTGVGSLTWIGLRRLESGATVRAAQARAKALPLAAQLLAAAVAAGSPPLAATEAVADALGGPIGQLLRSAAASARVAADPASGWLMLAADPALRPLARALAGAETRGTSPVIVLERAAKDARDTARWAAEARARSLGARAAAPLGLCLLPAFVLVGIVPVVVAAGPILP